MLDIRIYESEKAPFNKIWGDGTIFEGIITVADSDDTDTLYSGLGQALHVAEEDITAFGDLAEDSVEAMLEDAKKQGFIEDYEIEETEE